MNNEKIELILQKFNNLHKKGYLPIIGSRGKMLVITFEDLELMQVEHKGKTTYLCNFEKRPTHYFSEEEIKIMIDFLYGKMDSDELVRHKIYQEKDKTVIPNWLEDLK